mmetsp:Transcript_125260/g.243814  ORF Transcript_125260/g.243814 Transcript_125260/m.243814 type:complete len:155 (-) Transcript_125260:307-771(-)
MAPKRALSRSNIIDASFDLNGDGRILRSEVKKARQEQQKKQLKILRRQGLSKGNILDPALDKNRDGRVTRSESRAAQAKASAKKVVTKACAKKVVMKVAAMKVMKAQKQPAAKRVKRVPRRAPAVVAKTFHHVRRLKRTASRLHWTRSGSGLKD